MPELPEVHTTTEGLKKKITNLFIKDLWSDMWSSSRIAQNTIKDKKYFPYFKKNVLCAKIISVSRRAKNILINLDNGFTIVIHMKMTGHLMYGKYELNKNSNGKEWMWIPADKKSPLNDKYNRHIHVVFTLSNGHHLVFCDSRKFGTIEIFKTENLFQEKFKNAGPEPLLESFTLKDFKERLLKSNRAIKTVLMDVKIIAGIGNIYSDEMLFRAHILPARITKSLTDAEWKLLFKSMKEVLNKGIEFGGDSMSDYRNVNGEKGKFQEKHLVYLRSKEKCKTKNCSGLIHKQKINGRSAHFCIICQK